MASRDARTHAPSTGQARTPTSIAANPDDVLQPIIAGAEARGMADAFDLIGLPAVFLAGDGRVLFANAPAHAMLGHCLAIRADHIVATGAANNKALAGLIAGALGAAGGKPLCSAVLRAAGATSAVTVHAMATPLPMQTPGQMLRAVLLLDDGRDAALTAFLARMAPKPGCAPTRAIAA